MMMMMMMMIIIIIIIYDHDLFLVASVNEIFKEIHHIFLKIILKMIF